MQNILKTYFVLYNNKQRENVEVIGLKMHILNCRNEVIYNR